MSDGRPAWHPHRRELWPGTIMRADGRPFSNNRGCSLHNCVEVVRRDDGAYRCLLCESDERDFLASGKPRHRQMAARYAAWMDGRFMPWTTPQGGQDGKE